MAGDNQHFCLRWNNHQSTLVSVFDTLLESGTLVDCTLAAEGQYLNAHKVVLCACSPFLEILLSQHHEKHPIVILKDIKFQELKSMMDYMYRGEVNITQDQLSTFLKAAESLQIKGLTDGGGNEDGAASSAPSKAPIATPVRKPVHQSTPRPSAAAQGLTIERRPESPHIRSRDDSASPTPRKRRRNQRRPSTSDDPDSHIDTSNSCDVPPLQSGALSGVGVPNIPATITKGAPLDDGDHETENSRVNNHDALAADGVAGPKIEPTGGELIEPKTEYMEEMNNEDSIEDLTLDDDDDMDNSVDMSRAGPSHDNSNQSFGQWPMSGNQTDEVFMAAQDAVGAHRDTQDFDSEDLGGSSVLDSDYLTMLSSSDKLISGEFEALERLQAELDLFDDPNRPEEIVEQMVVDNDIDLIEEEVCSDAGDAMIVTENIKDEIIDLDSELEDTVQPSVNDSNEIKSEHLENTEVVTLSQSQSQSETSTCSSTATKRSAPSSVPGIPQPKKSLLTKVMLSSIPKGIPTTSTGRNQQIVFNVPIGQRPQLGSTRTITLTQARQMGLLAPGCRLQTVTSSSNVTQNKNMMVNKISGTIKKGTNAVKSSGPTKILPAPTLITKNPMIQQQKIFIRQGSVFKQGTLVSTNNGANQVIRLPSIVGQSTPVSTIQHIRLPTVNATTVSGLQQVRMPVTSGIQQVLPNKQVQYIRLVPTTATSSLSPVVSVNNSTVPPKQPQIVTLSTSTPKSNVKTATATKTFITNNQQPVSSHYKVFTASSHTVTTSQQRPILPASKPSTSSSVESKKPCNSNIPSMNSSSKQVLTPKVTIKEEFIEEIIPVRKEDKKETNMISPTLPKLGRPLSSTLSGLSDSKLKTTDVNKTKKPCNCTRSQCLKLYCDCFANGEFCYQCNCNSCFNNMEHEEERAQAIRSVLDRNPNAFRPKIKSFVGHAERQHTKGCNCKRSGCLKNYCECFEARIACSQNCKCVGCRNMDDDTHTPFRDHPGSLSVEHLKSRTKSANFVTSFGSMQAANAIQSQPFKFFTSDVVQASCRCLLARGMEAKKLNAGAEECQRIIIEEYGQCLVKIMDLASEKSFL